MSHSLLYRYKLTRHNVGSSVTAYARAIANCEIAWLQANARPHSPTSPLYRSATENDPQTHIELLQAYLSVVDHLIPPRQVRASTLWHPDLHASNIILTSPPTEIPRIESIIDWQTARIEPLFYTGSIPDFVDINILNMLRFPLRATLPSFRPTLTPWTIRLRILPRPSCGRPRDIYYTS